MNPFAWNLVLAFIWIALSGMFSPAGFLIGLVVGYFVIALAGPAVGVKGYGKRVVRVISFLFFYLGDLILSNLRVALDVMRPRMRSRPAFVGIPVHDLSDNQITLLANLITMTPGTLSIDVSSDKSTLYIHAMFVDDPDSLRKDIRQALIRRVKEVID